jgi:hypothetical protein
MHSEVFVLGNAAGSTSMLRAAVSPVARSACPFSYSWWWGVEWLLDNLAGCGWAVPQAVTRRSNP